MNESTRAIRGPRRAWPRTARAAAAIIATAALTLPGTACSAGRSSGRPGVANVASSTRSASSSPSSSASNDPVAHSHCMRSHGVPNFPDPDSNGQLSKGDAQLFGVSTSQLQTAQTACQPLYPNNGSFQQQTQQCMLTGECPQAVVQQVLIAERKFAQCMRSYGVPDWPDPTIDSEGRPCSPCPTCPATTGVTGVRRSSCPKTANVSGRHPRPCRLGEVSR
jgi:hypothetical protein